MVFDLGIAMMIKGLILFLTVIAINVFMNRLKFNEYENSDFLMIIIVFLIFVITNYQIALKFL